MLVGLYSGGSHLVVNTVGLIPEVSSTVLGVLIIVGEYAVDSSENDLPVLPSTCRTLLNVGEKEAPLLAYFGDDWFASGVVDTACEFSQGR